MTFQVLEYKGKHFLDLNNNNNLPTIIYQPSLHIQKIAPSSIFSGIPILCGQEQLKLS